MRKTLITLTALTAIIGAGVIGPGLVGFEGTAQAAPAFIGDGARPLVQQAEYYGDWRREREWRHHEERRREEARWHRHHGREW